MNATIDGLEWVQKPFPYQGKCLAWLNDMFSSLGNADQNSVREIVDGTGCERLLQ